MKADEFRQYLNSQLPTDSWNAIDGSKLIFTINHDLEDELNVSNELYRVVEDFRSSRVNMDNVHEGIKLIVRANFNHLIFGNYPKEIVFDCRDKIQLSESKYQPIPIIGKRLEFIRNGIFDDFSYLTELDFKSINLESVNIDKKCNFLSMFTSGSYFQKFLIGKSAYGDKNLHNEIREIQLSCFFEEITIHNISCKKASITDLRLNQEKSTPNIVNFSDSNIENINLRLMNNSQINISDNVNHELRMVVTNNLASLDLSRISSDKITLTAGNISSHFINRVLFESITNLKEMRINSMRDGIAIGSLNVNETIFLNCDFSKDFVGIANQINTNILRFSGFVNRGNLSFNNVHIKSPKLSFVDNLKVSFKLFLSKINYEVEDGMIGRDKEGIFTSSSKLGDTSFINCIMSSALYIFGSDISKIQFLSSVPPINVVSLVKENSTFYEMTTYQQHRKVFDNSGYNTNSDLK